MTNSQIKKRELNMLERMAILQIAEESSKTGISSLHSLKEGDKNYILSLGREGKEYYYEYLNYFKNNKRFPVRKKG